MPKSMFDSAWPPGSPPSTDAVAFYIGGNTPHKWYDSEILRMPQRFRLPIWVRPMPGYDPNVDADLCVAWAMAHGQPRGTPIAIDLETLIDAPYVIGFNARLAAHGYLCLEYGSDGYIFSNPLTSGGRWGAHYGIGKQIEAGEVATQYANPPLTGGPWDLSLVADSVPLWDTQSHPPAPIPPIIYYHNGSDMVVQMTVGTDAAGAGYAQSPVPWNQWNGSIGIQGSWPPRDKEHWTGEIHPQEVNGFVGFDISGWCKPGQPCTVFIGSTVTG